jgi:hypothetical protein
MNELDELVAKGLPMKKQFLLKRHKVSMYIYPGFEGALSERFARLLHGTWKRIPLWARRRILKFWRESAWDANHTRFWLLGDFRINIATGKHAAFGAVGHAGHMIRFHAPSIAEMPDDVVVDLIAHEMAHVTQCAVGFVAESCGGDMVSLEESTYGEREWDADMLMEDWGFDVNSIDRWSAEVGRVKQVEMSEAEYVNHIFTGGGRYTETERDEDAFLDSMRD